MKLNIATKLSATLLVGMTLACSQNSGSGGSGGNANVEDPLKEVSIEGKRYTFSELDETALKALGYDKPEEAFEVKEGLAVDTSLKVGFSSVSETVLVTPAQTVKAQTKHSIVKNENGRITTEGISTSVIPNVASGKMRTVEECQVVTKSETIGSSTSSYSTTECNVISEDKQVISGDESKVDSVEMCQLDDSTQTFVARTEKIGVVKSEGLKNSLLAKQIVTINEGEVICTVGDQETKRMGRGRQIWTDIQVPELKDASRPFKNSNSSKMFYMETMIFEDGNPQNTKQISKVRREILPN